MIYCQFKTLSTGYIQGSIPPQFKDELKRPIDKLGSDGVYKLDARKSLSNQIQDCLDRIEQLKNVSKGIVGFEIIKANSYSKVSNIVNGSKAKVVYKSY